MLENRAFEFTFPEHCNKSIIIPIKVIFPIFEENSFEAKKIGIKVRALIDTGATNSCISEYYAKSCHLIATQYSTMRSANGIHTVPLYMLDVALSDNIIFENVPTLQIMGGSEFDFIIGMDILSKGNLSITNSKENTVFKFEI